MSHKRLEMFLSPKGAVFIKKKEKCRLIAYKDLAGVYTIGWGTTSFITGIPVVDGDKISQKEADVLFDLECDGIGLRLESLIKVTLVQNQIDALISFCYNVGVNAFKTSTLLRIINSRRDILEDYFTRWDKAHIDGKLVKVKGLFDRRKAEYKLFMS